MFMPEELPAYLASTNQVIQLLTETLERMVSTGEKVVAEPSAEIKSRLDQFLKRPSTMRDGILILLAYAVASGAPLDFRKLPKFPGARGVSQFVAELLPTLNIACTQDAFQTGVKGLTTYYGRQNQPWRDILGWASDQPGVEPIERAFLYLAAGIAETARDLPPRPELDTPLLTFARVFAVLDHMLGLPSNGALEQFIFAALLEAYLNQLGDNGEVSTKNIFASDASASTAADVQHKYGNQVWEAYEITGSDWRLRLGQASKTVTVRELRRIHILGSNVIETSGDDLATELAGPQDIAVLDLREEVRSLVARLDKPHRREALARLYDHLVTKQSNDALIYTYVDQLTARRLTERR
jgi:hypothetical protein